MSPSADKVPSRSRAVQSILGADGVVRISLATVTLDEPSENEVVVRMEAAPINPSDLGHMFGFADAGGMRAETGATGPVLALPVSAEAMERMKLRVGVAIQAGNEGAGTVVAAGSSEAARSLLGKVVAVRGPGSYAEYRKARAQECLTLVPGTTAKAGASAFINPLTALGFLETARASGHRSIVHTAAASNLGRMLLRLCRAEGITLVSIVRSQQQLELLKSEGGEYVLDMTASDFDDRLFDVFAATATTLGFDAIGGGRLTGRILTAMERAMNRDNPAFDRYGSATLKHVYICGSLDTGPIELPQTFGKAWGVGGWLLTNFLQSTDPARVSALKRRVAAEINTIFQSQYGEELSLDALLDPSVARRFKARATGLKFLVRPHFGTQPTLGQIL